MIILIEFFIDLSWNVHSKEAKVRDLHDSMPNAKVEMTLDFSL
jgi:hypothetical protein